jgi:hypothetical protein
MPRSPRVRGGRSLVAAMVCLLATAVPALPAQAADQTVTVDLASSTGTATGAGSGFLYGLSQDGSVPGDSLLGPLNVKSGRGGGARIAGHGWIGDNYTAGSGYQVRITSALAQARRLTRSPNHASYDLLVSDLWGADTEQPSNTVYPCTGGDCANWTSFVDRVVSDVQASGLTVNYDVWNEPDGTAFWAPGVNTAQYFQMWDTAVREIRRLAPSASIMGPSISGWNPNTLASFLDHAKAAGTVPGLLNWHFSGNPVGDAQTATSLLSARGISGVELAMNEYLFSQEQHAGYQAWYLAQLGKSGISAADHAIWSDCCVTGSLDSTLVNDGGVLRPTGQWWVYKAYADVTGQLARVTTGGTTDAVAAKDQSRGRVTVLLGDSGGNTGTVNLTVNGIDANPWLAGSTGVRVTVQRIPDQSPLSEPLTVSSQVVPANSASVQIPIGRLASTDAYSVTLSPATSTPDTVTIDGTATSAALNYFQYGANWGQTNGVGDMYNGTANWSFTPGSVAQLHFTGRQAVLHAVRDVDQGQMVISVDNSAPVTVDNYAATRNASGVAWTSPLLNPGSHTVLITVGPNKNPAGRGNNIALDRADIT